VTGVLLERDLYHHMDSEKSDSKSVSTEELLKLLEAIPPLPTQVTKVCEMAQDAETEDKDFAKVIESDQVLAARLLKVANSAFYGRSSSVGTVFDAISVLGHQGVRNLVLSIGLLAHKMGGKTAPEKRETFWRHSITVATLSRHLGGLFSGVDPSETFLAGLMHDIGKLVFMEFYADVYDEVWEKTASNGKLLHENEKELFGIDHSSLGSKLCQKWKIPPPLDRAVGFHQMLIDEKRIAARQDLKALIVRVADNLARISGLGRDGESHVGLDILKILDRKNLFLDNFYQILLALPKYVEEVEAIFSLSSLKSPIDRSSRRFNVCLSDGSESDVLKLVLVGQGHEAIVPVTLSKLEGSMDPVIIDSPLPEDILSILESKGVSILNFTTWKNNHAGSIQSGNLNVSDLRGWIRHQLPDFNSSRIINTPKA